MLSWRKVILHPKMRIMPLVFGLILIPILAFASEKIHVETTSAYAPLVESFLRDTERRLSDVTDQEVDFEMSVIDEAALANQYKYADFQLLIVPVIKAPIVKGGGRLLAAFASPFLLSNTQQLTKLQSTPLGEYALGASAENGILGLSYVNFGFTWLFSSAAVASSDEVAGMRMAVDDTETQEVAAALGASTLKLPSMDLRSAFSTGDIDSAAVSSEDVADFLPNLGKFAQPGLQAKVAVILTSRKRWDEIPFRLQSDILDAFNFVVSQKDAALSKLERKNLSAAEDNSIRINMINVEDSNKSALEWADHNQVNTDFLMNLRDSAADLQQNTPHNNNKRGDIFTSAVSIAFFTDRHDVGGNPDGRRFGYKRSPTISCGKAEQSPNLSGYKSIFLSEIHSSSEKCLKYAKSISSNDNGILLFIHGFNTPFSDAIERLRSFGSSINFSGQLVLWSWASHGRLRDYPYDSDSASDTWRRLTSVISVLSQSSSDVTLLAHSMGNRPLLQALQEFAKSGHSQIAENIVFVAPDVARDIFANNAPTAVKKLAARTTLYECSWDWALLLSQKLHDFPRAGQGGSHVLVLQNIETIDTAPQIGSANHSYLFNTPYGLRDAHGLVVENKAALARGLTRQSVNAGVFWKLAP